MRLARVVLSGMVLLSGVALSRDARAQCQLANPSFEHRGSGTVFGGWNQFGSVSSSTRAAHGTVAARVSGPNTGNWDVSGFWQQMDTAPGQQWTVSVCVLNPSTNPLVGQNRAIVNVEWHDAAGNLLSYESHDAATASTPTDHYQVFTFTSGPAPAGTASTHLLLGNLQSPTDPVSDVLYDAATFSSSGPPTLADKQWLDFPSGRTLSFSGRTWRVKGPGFLGPGPNNFSNNASAVYTDANGRLHLTIQKVANTWFSTEVALADPLGYGDYVFTTRGRLDNFALTTVLGMFIWEYGSCYDPANGWWNPYNEIDVEFGRWGVSGNADAQFVAQPFDTPGNINRFNMTFSDSELTSHAFKWLPDHVEYRSWRGGPNAESPATRTHTWTYSGADVPRPGIARVHLNMWQATGAPATAQEAVFDAFTFVPACAGPDCGVLAVTPPAARPDGASAPAPNPFRAGTAIRFTSAQAGDAELVVYDLLGRRQRTLLHETLPAGEHAVRWDGRDDAGAKVAPGVYLYRLRLGDRVETKRMVLVK